MKLFVVMKNTMDHTLGYKRHNDRQINFSNVLLSLRDKLSNILDQEQIQKIQETFRFQIFFVTDLSDIFIWKQGDLTDDDSMQKSVSERGSVIFFIQIDNLYMDNGYLYHLIFSFELNMCLLKSLLKKHDQCPKVNSEPKHL